MLKRLKRFSAKSCISACFVSFKKITVNFVGIWILLAVFRWLVPYYDGEAKYFPMPGDDKNNEIRLNEARRLLESYQVNLFSDAKVAKDLTIGVISSPRFHYSYLTQTLAFLLHAYTASPPNIFICDTRYPEVDFPEINQFRKLLPIIEINANASKSTRLDLNTEDLRIRKEGQDYWKCLCSSNFSQVEYVLLIEDDSIPIPGFSAALQSLIDQLDYRPHIDFVKLYHPWTLRKIPSLVQAIASSVLIAYCLYFIFHHSVPLLIVLILLTVGSIQHFYFNIFSDFRYLITSSVYITLPESCCTPAVIFRSSRLPEMCKYFPNTISESGHAKDHILDESPFIGRATDFNLVVHVGHFSKIRDKVIHISEELVQRRGLFQLLFPFDIPFKMPYNAL